MAVVDLQSAFLAEDNLVKTPFKEEEFPPLVKHRQQEKADKIKEHLLSHKLVSVFFLSKIMTYISESQIKTSPLGDAYRTRISSVSGMQGDKKVASKKVKDQ